MNQSVQKWAIFQAAAHNYGAAGQVGPCFDSESAAILSFMKTYGVSKDEWEKGVKEKKYVVRTVIG